MNKRRRSKKIPRSGGEFERDGDQRLGEGENFCINGQQ